MIDSELISDSHQENKYEQMLLEINELELGRLT